MEIFKFLKPDAAFSHRDFAEFLLEFFREIRLTVERAYIQRDVLLLGGESDSRPINNVTL